MESIEAQDVIRRSPLLKRISSDVSHHVDSLRRRQERLEELVEISRRFSSCEIHETITNLRNSIAEHKRELENCEREVRELGGTLRDRKRGIVYFNGHRDGRPILLVWDPSQPTSVSWHEVDENFSDRILVDFPEGAEAAR